MSFCRRLADAEQKNPRLTPEEREIGSQFLALVSRQETNLSAARLKALKRCLDQVYSMLERTRQAAATYSRMSTLLDILAHRQNTGSGDAAMLHLRNTDALRFCQSLKESADQEVSVRESHVAEELTKLIAQGV